VEELLESLLELEELLVRKQAWELEEIQVRKLVWEMAEELLERSLA
jgi:hypothetical protein